MRAATSCSEPSTASLIAEVREVRESLSALKRKTMKDGISLEIENQGGEVYFRPLGTVEGPVALNIELKNKNGNIYFEPNAPSAHSSSWLTGTWAKLLVAAGTIYMYRNELRIIGRGVLAGANLAVERWEDHRRQQDSDKKEDKKNEEQSNDSDTSTTGTEEQVTMSAQPFPTVHTIPTLPSAEPNLPGGHTFAPEQPKSFYGNTYFHTVNYPHPSSYTCPTGNDPKVYQFGPPIAPIPPPRGYDQAAYNREVQENHRNIHRNIVEDMLGEDKGKSVASASSDIGPFSATTNDDRRAAWTGSPSQGSVNAAPKRSYYSSGYEPDTEGQDKPLYCGGARVVGYQTGTAS